jgi:hypothetical protein
VIYSDDYLPTIDELFDICSQNYDQDRCLLFNERAAFKNIINNNKFDFFANSFLIEVSVLKQFLQNITMKDSLNIK